MKCPWCGNSTVFTKLNPYGIVRCDKCGRVWDSNVSDWVSKLEVKKMIKQLAAFILALIFIYILIQVVINFLFQG